MGKDLAQRIEHLKSYYGSSGTYANKSIFHQSNAQPPMERACEFAKALVALGFNIRIIQTHITQRVEVIWVENPAASLEECAVELLDEVEHYVNDAISMPVSDRIVLLHAVSAGFETLINKLKELYAR